jgi:hypothetical protein
MNADDLQGFVDVTALWDGPAVYALVLDGEVQYIGKSNCAFRRISEHKRDGKVRFNRIFVRMCNNEQDQKILERRLIASLRPKLDRSKGGFRRPPLMVDG